MREADVCIEKRDTKHLTGDGKVLEKKSCTCGIILVIVAVSTFFYVSIGMKTQVNIEALILPASVPVAQTKASLNNMPFVASGLNDKALSTICHNVTKGRSQQLSNCDTSILGINENQSNKDKLAKGRQKDIMKATPAVDNISNTSNAVLSHNRIILIVAYMRTGSTLTGSIFQEYPDTFYVFEPIRLLDNTFNGVHGNDDTQVTLKYPNGTKRQYKSSEKNKVISDEINSWLNCKLDSISKLSLTNNHHKQFTKVMKKFYICSENYNSNRPKIGQAGPTSLKETSVMLDGCLTETKESCEKAPLVALKFIRWRMKEVTKLLPLYPNMKIIHLVRDPRGILNSRIRIQDATTKTYRQTVQSHCSSIENDLKFSKAILQTYPNRLKLVQYEDLAEKPLKTARALVEFAGLTFVKSIQTFIKKQTRASCDAGIYTTQRRHSGQTAIKWRSQIDPEIARYTYDNCKTSNTILGYLPLESLQALRNQTIPSRKLQDVVKNLNRYLD